MSLRITRFLSFQPKTIFIFYPATVTALVTFNSGSNYIVWSVGTVLPGPTGYEGANLFIDSSNNIFVTGGANQNMILWKYKNNCTCPLFKQGSETISSSDLKKPIATETPLIEEMCNKTVYNYPNPVKDTTTIRFPLQIQQNVSITIYDIQDRVVWTKQLGSSDTFVGINTVIWSAQNDIGRKVANGVYLLKVATKDKTIIKKIAVIH